MLWWANLLAGNVSVPRRNGLSPPSLSAKVACLPSPPSLTAKVACLPSGALDYFLVLLITVSDVNYMSLNENTVI